jgi:CubicO group peptidase (beta-lactamase class C family)
MLEPTNDWRTTSPTEQGVDAELLEAADRRIRDGYPTTFCLLVVRHGALVFERYYGGHDRSSLFDVRSVTKSVVSTLVGIAVGDGLLDLMQDLGQLLPDRLPPDADPRVRSITVESLLTMTAGFAWDDLADFWRLLSSDDWVGTTLRMTLAADPGQVFTYNSGCSQLLSVTLTRLTGKRLADVAAERLFGPLGIVPGGWPRDPQGLSIGAYGLELSARDLAKLGLLYLRGGQLGEVQLLPADYVRRATAPQSASGFPEDTAYGYHWWVTEVADHAAFFAAGYGGQYLFVVPDLDLIVVTTAEWRGAPEDLYEPRPVIEETIVPAAKL